MPARTTTSTQAATARRTTWASTRDGDNSEEEGGGGGGGGGQHEGVCNSGDGCGGSAEKSTVGRLVRFIGYKIREGRRPPRRKVSSSSVPVVAVLVKSASALRSFHLLSFVQYLDSGEHLRIRVEQKQ
ncbi:hypothetical protein GQ55_2G106500 [Panicum hallii var. hallii]|uniref:Uncharacterized protein n=1 Tax=Panicum hallii var. hallii TaxID=1504633 RepID=A0A2T7ENK8_9POAL|nr:hypothetical protein GQ55_2G106500 [Panicum hallii var. hallii]